MQAEVRPEDKVITVDANNNGTKNILIETKKVLFLIKLVTCNALMEAVTARRICCVRHLSFDLI